MEKITVEHLNFTYPGETAPALRDVSFSLRQGEFALLIGASGSGKTTLLRLLKPEVAPQGEKSGGILYDGAPALALRESARSIGFVGQSPEEASVGEKLYAELAFGLENLGIAQGEMRARVAETAAFFGLEPLFHREVASLSGGQKQLLNLAAVMVLRPRFLLLDEPTAQLDPLAASHFLDALAKINRELGTAILLSEHRLEEAFALSGRILALENGCLLTDAAPRRAARLLQESTLAPALPTAARVFLHVPQGAAAAAQPGGDPLPLTVGEGRIWLGTQTLQPLPPKELPVFSGTPALAWEQLWFRYERELSDVLSGFSGAVYAGEIFAILGGNGAGKSTALALLSGLRKPYRGKISLFGQALEKIPCEERTRRIGLLMQDPQALFVKSSVREDLQEVFADSGLPKEEQRRLFEEMTALCGLEGLLSRHPFDLSGGEQQRLALAKILLLRPRILLLDEPTKGQDAAAKARLAQLLRRLQREGRTLVLVSHDMEFCAAVADRCGLFFDGQLVGAAPTQAFFSANSFYTSSAHRMSDGILPGAILAEELIAACGAAVPSAAVPGVAVPGAAADEGADSSKMGETPPPKSGADDAALPAKGANASAENHRESSDILKKTDFPLKKSEKKAPFEAINGNIRNIFPADRIFSLLFLLFLIPATVYCGTRFLPHRAYLAVSFALLFEILAFFFLSFERRRPNAAELLVLATLCSIGVCGRAAFFMLPQVKPVVALAIVAGIAFGGEVGFLTGAMTAFLSNLFFGQGPWTPWQMVAFGLVGFLAGVVFPRFLPRGRATISLFGFLCVLLLCGPLLDLSAAFLWQEAPSAGILASYLLTGLPFNLLHAGATALFLWFFAEIFLEKLERIHVKYGIFLR